MSFIVPSEPPGCCSRNSVTSYTFPRTVIQQSVWQLCLATSSAVNILVFQSVRKRQGRTCGFNIKNKFVGLNSRAPVPRTLPRIYRAGVFGNRRDWIRRPFTILVSSGPNLGAGKLRQPHTTCSEQPRDNSQGIIFLVITAYVTR